MGEELRLARLQARTAFENATRERFEAQAALDRESAGRHERLARQWRAMETRATTIAEMLTGAQETRRQWAALTEPIRRVAVAADLELRRRYPDQYLPPLKLAVCWWRCTGGAADVVRARDAPASRTVGSQASADSTTAAGRIALIEHLR